MFRGRYEHTIDQKGRISIPSRFREVLIANYDERLILSNFDNCLWGYPVKEWKLVEDKVASLPQFRPVVKSLQRFFISAACECPLDSTGRIIIPPTLRKYAGLTSDVVVVGMTKRIEFWALDRWKKIFDQAEGDLGTMGSELADLGL